MTVLTPPHKVIGKKDPDIPYTDRFAFRVVVFHPSGQVAISHPWNHFRYRLPGGFTDTGLNHETATRHELEWETGGRIMLRDGGSIASTEEWQDDIQVRQVSYCYLAELVQTLEEDGVTDEMLNEKLKLNWMSVEEAKEMMEGEEPTSELGRFIKERDWFFLDVATKEAVKK